jgi:hypothetical protein
MREPGLGSKSNSSLTRDGNSYFSQGRKTSDSPAVTFLTDREEEKEREREREKGEKEEKKATKC